MEGPNALKRTVHDDNILESASKRLKPTDSTPAESPVPAPPLDSHAHEIRAEPSVADVPEGVAKAEHGAERTKRARGNDTPGKTSKRKKKDEKKPSHWARRGTRNDEVAEGNNTQGSGQPDASRLPKRRCALLIGFCGSGYSGMQIQPDHTKTIEGVLFQAMVRAGAVSQDNADDPVKIGLARAARTDAGVHAAGNLVSLKMITTVPDVPDIVARINEELPPEIRLWGYVRVQNSFNARMVCDSRKYTYFFPSYLLLPPKPGSGLDRSLQQYVASLSFDPEVQAADREKMLHPFWADADLSGHDEELARKRAWRVAPAQVERLRDIVKKFEGTHNFHNFTVARDFSDRSNQRHMKKIEIADPVVYGDTEWISVLFHGQSFMLHQRKMMSALVLACRTDTPEQVIDELYGPRVVFIPKMPSLGLLLEEPLFDSYNTRMAPINEKLDPSDPDYRPPISFEDHRNDINAFKQKYIYDNMRQVEDRDGLFDAWMRYVDAYGGNDLLYLNPKGTIPPAAVIKKKERRENPFKEKKRFDATSFLAEDEKAKLMDEDDEEEAQISKKDLADTEG
ncbi:pseudouridine synthase [Lyophyllum atratum]|nr:pseudouridine synthase [Lyophyllum atratum]